MALLSGQLVPGLGGGSYFWLNHFASTLPFSQQEMPEPMLLDDPRLQENDTIDDVEPSGDSDLRSLRLQKSRRYSISRSCCMSCWGVLLSRRFWTFTCRTPGNSANFQNMSAEDNTGFASSMMQRDKDHPHSHGSDIPPCQRACVPHPMWSIILSLLAGLGWVGTWPLLVGAMSHCTAPVPTVLTRRVPLGRPVSNLRGADHPRPC